MRRDYLCGPMTGRPHFNYPAFDAAARLLRLRGRHVVTPSELDTAEHRAQLMTSHTGAPEDYPDGKTWGDFLAHDVRLLADDLDGHTFVLPGWARSRGARLETFVTHLCGREVRTLDGVRVPVWRLALAWAVGR